MILYYSKVKKFEIDYCEELEISEHEYDQSFRQDIVDDYYKNNDFSNRNFFVFNEEGKLIDSFSAKTNNYFTIGKIQ